MSQSIWTYCKSEDFIRKLALSVYRICETQEDAATMRIVDSYAEQSLLEELLEKSKPNRINPQMHYLLTTPFRYPPLRYGSRFGSRGLPSLFYGSEKQETAFAECAYYRFRFLSDTAGAKAMQKPIITSHTLFKVPLVSEHGVDLTTMPFSAYQDDISNKKSYDKSQQLGVEMRQAGVKLFRFVSARCPQAGINLGLFDRSPFALAKPQESSTWHSRLGEDQIEFSSESGDSFRWKIN